MSDWQQFVATGNLVSSPKRYKLKDDNWVCHFRLASSGMEPKDTLFIDVQGWGPTGDSAFKYLDKGDKVLVVGFLKNHEWVTQTQEKKRTIEVRLRRLVFLNTKKRYEQRENQTGEQNAETE